MKQGKHAFCQSMAYLTTAFAQLTYPESLRDIEVNLRTQTKRTHHMGLHCKTICHSALVNAARPSADKTQLFIAMAAVCARMIADSTERKVLRRRRHHDRFAFLGLLVDAVLGAQGGIQTLLPAGHALRHPHFQSHYRRQKALDKYLGTYPNRVASTSFLSSSAS